MAASQRSEKKIADTLNSGDFSMVGDRLVGPNGRPVPTCTSCRNHGVLSPYRGHKRSCPYRNCRCFKCSLIPLRREVTQQHRMMQRTTAPSSQFPPTNGHRPPPFQADAAQYAVTWSCQQPVNNPNSSHLSVAHSIEGKPHALLWSCCIAMFDRSWLCNCCNMPVFFFLHSHLSVIPSSQAKRSFGEMFHL